MNNNNRILPKEYKKYHPFDLNTNSILYTYQNEIYKIPYYIKEDLEDILNYLKECNLNELVQINKMLYQNEKLVGYSMNNYNNYKSMKKNRHRTLRLKKEDCKKIITASEKLNKYNIIFNDYHESNILLNNETNNIKICDIDAIKISDDERLKKLQIKQSIVLCISYLYNVKKEYMNLLIRSNTEVNKSRLINDFLKLENIKLEGNTEILDKIDYDIIDEDKKVLKKYIKEEREKSCFYQYFDF